ERVEGAVIGSGVGDVAGQQQIADAPELKRLAHRRFIGLSTEPELVMPAADDHQLCGAMALDRVQYPDGAWIRFLRLELPDHADEETIVGNSVLRANLLAIVSVCLVERTRQNLVTKDMDGTLEPGGPQFARDVGGNRDDEGHAVAIVDRR